MWTRPGFSWALEKKAHSQQILITAQGRGEKTRFYGLKNERAIERIKTCISGQQTVTQRSGTGLDSGPWVSHGFHHPLLYTLLGLGRAVPPGPPSSSRTTDPDIRTHFTTSFVCCFLVTRLQLRIMSIVDPTPPSTEPHYSCSSYVENGSLTPTDQHTYFYVWESTGFLKFDDQTSFSL